MNTILLRLAQDAGLYTITNGRLYPVSMSAEESIISYNLFARMIVRESVSVIADAVDRREPASGYVDMIKEHFGVNIPARPRTPLVTITQEEKEALSNWGNLE